MDNFITILDYAPYIEGKLSVDNNKKVPRLTMEQAVQFAEHVHSDQVAEQLFDMCEKYADFFSMHVDARTWISKELQAEAFYAAKNGTFNESIPSFCVYLIQKAWKDCFGIPNLLFKVLPKQYITQFFISGYFSSGYSLQEVVSAVCDTDYVPLAEYRKKIRHTDYSEIYVADTDMVAAVPNRIADELTDGMIDIIKVTTNGLAVGETLIRTMGGSYGITNSVYDLRELV